MSTPVSTAVERWVHAARDAGLGLWISSREKKFLASSSREKSGLRLARDGCFILLRRAAPAAFFFTELQ
jgi:hypothetical protein